MCKFDASLQGVVGCIKPRMKTAACKPFDLEEAQAIFCAMPRMYRVLKCDVDAYVMPNPLGVVGRQVHEFVKLVIQSEGGRPLYLCAHWGVEGLSFQRYATHGKMAATMSRLRSASGTPDNAALYDLIRDATKIVYIDDVFRLCEALQEFSYHLLHSNCQHFSRLVWETVYQLSGGGEWLAMKDPTFKSVMLADMSEISNPLREAAYRLYRRPLPDLGSMARRLGIYHNRQRLGAEDICYTINVNKSLLMSVLSLFGHLRRFDAASEGRALFRTFGSLSMYIYICNSDEATDSTSVFVVFPVVMAWLLYRAVEDSFKDSRTLAIEDEAWNQAQVFESLSWKIGDGKVNWQCQRRSL